MAKNVKTFYTHKELADALSVHSSSIRKLYSRDGFPKSKGSKHNAVKVCEWILDNTSKRSKLWLGANLFLGGQDEKKSLSTGKKTSKPTKKTAKEAKNEPLPEILKNEKTIKTESLEAIKEEDFESILDSFRRTVYESVKLCEEASASGDEKLLQARLKTSGQAVEQLRKAEQSILDIQLARKSSLPADDVRVAFVSLASTIKSKLLQLPMKLSHELAGTQTAGEAQEILDEEIRLILNDLSTNPFSAV